MKNTSVLVFCLFFSVVSLAHGSSDISTFDITARIVDSSGHRIGRKVTIAAYPNRECASYIPFTIAIGGFTRSVYGCCLQGWGSYHFVLNTSNKVLKAIIDEATERLSPDHMQTVRDELSKGRVFGDVVYLNRNYGEFTPEARTASIAIGTYTLEFKATGHYHWAKPLPAAPDDEDVRWY